MSTITWPAGVVPRNFSMRLAAVQRVFSAPFSGSEQAVDLLNDRWKVSMDLTPRDGYDWAAQIEAFIAALRGQTNDVSLWHFARPTVRGTLASATASSAAQGASAVTLSGTGTLKAGDMLGISGLLLQVAADVTLAGSGSVTLVNRLRTAVSGTVTLIRPTASFRLASPGAGVQYSPGMSEAISLDFVEKVA